MMLHLEKHHPVVARLVEHEFEYLLAKALPIRYSKPELRSKNETARIAAGRVDTGSPTWARTRDLRINSLSRTAAFQRLRPKSVPQLAQIRRRESVYWRGVHRNCGTNFSDVCFPFSLLNARHLTDGESFHRAKLTFRYDGRFAGHQLSLASAN